VNEFISDQTLAWVILAAFYVFGIAPAFFLALRLAAIWKTLDGGFLSLCSCCFRACHIFRRLGRMTTIIPMVAASV